MILVEDLSGFVCLFRTLLGWEWHDDPNTLSVFIHLLLLASFRQKTWHGILIERGQAIVGRKNLAKSTGLSEQQVRTALRKLKSTNEITIRPTNKFSIVTIVNYGKYQNFNAERNQQSNQQMPNEQPTSNQQLTSNQPHLNKENNLTRDNKERGATAPLTLLHFVPPTVDDVQAYCSEHGICIEATDFVDYYAARGWKLSKGVQMKDWKAAARMWEKREHKEDSKDDEPWY